MIGKCFAVWLMVLALLAAGCDTQSPEDLRSAAGHLLGRGESVEYPRPGKPTVLEDGLLWYDIAATKNVPHMWILVPQDAAPLGTVLVGPYDTGGMPGGRLGPQDRTYLLLYAKNGFSVVGYDIPGFWEDNATDAEIGAALDGYIAADGGVGLVSQALDFLEHRLPGALADRVWTAGEGVSGSVALLAAARDSRIQAVTACDPIVDMQTLFEQEFLQHLKTLRPGLEHALARMSVTAIVPDLNCPVWLHHDVVGQVENEEAMRALNTEFLRYQKNVTSIDNLEVDLAHIGPMARIMRSLRWLESTRFIDIDN